MAKNLTIPTAALEQANARAGQTAERMIKTRATRKPNSDYLRLDLCPAGEDLKTYLTRRAAEVSAETGRAASVTAYLQDLIRQDMKRTQEQGTKHRLWNAIMALPADKVKVIEAVLQSWKD